MDYGSGIGNTAIIFGKHNWNVNIADVSTLLLEFAQFRLNSRKIKNTKYYLLKEKLPENKFDFVTCFDVLEHVFNPYEIVEKIRKSMKSGGILCLYVAWAAKEGEKNPSHVFVFDPNFVKKIKNLGFEYLPKDRDAIMKKRNHLFVFKKL